MPFQPPAGYLNKAALMRQERITRNTLRDLKQSGELVPVLLDGRELYRCADVAAWNARIVHALKKSIGHA